jgi:hypothetical protein
LCAPTAFPPSLLPVCYRRSVRRRRDNITYGDSRQPFFPFFLGCFCIFLKLLYFLPYLCLHSPQSEIRFSLGLSISETPLIPPGGEGWKSLFAKAWYTCFRSFSTCRIRSFTQYDSSMYLLFLVGVT